MRANNKTKEQLIEELRKQIIELEQEAFKRKQAEEALKESEELNRATLSSISDAVFLTDSVGEFVFICPNVDIIFGYSFQEVQEKGNISKIIGDDLFEFNELINSGEIANIETEIEDKYGQKHSLLVNVKNVSIKGGQVLYSCRDITERKLVEKQIQRQQYYLKKAQEIGAIGTWELDMVTNILIWTDQNYRNFGIPIDAPLTYETFLNQVHPDDREYVNSEWKTAIKGKPYDIEHRLIIDGNIRWVREKADVTFDEEGNGIYAIGFTQDITARKQMENDLIDAKKEIEKWNMDLEARIKEKTDELKKSQNLLIQSEKLTAMGKMAGGLAHELNSPLAGLIPMLEIHKQRAIKGSIEDKELNLMLRTADHMAKIVKDFGVFSRKSKSEFRALSLNEVIEDTLSFSGVRLKQKGIKVKEELSARLPLIRGDKTELQQVVLNMITNALDAMNEGGNYLITTDVNEGSNKVIMNFIDDGVGIAEEDLNKIFDPFFTTKKEGEGTGLGLSVSYGIIKNHGGEITVDSEPGKGTRFSIYLPAVKLNNK